MDLQEQDYLWFLENMESLYKEHGNKIAVVKNKSVLGIYDDFESALENTRKTEELGTFIIQNIYENKNRMDVLTTGYLVAEGVSWLK
jgi:hypothetical protein